MKIENYNFNAQNELFPAMTTAGKSYVKLSNLSEKKDYKLYGFYIHETQFGEQVCFVIDNNVVTSANKTVITTCKMILDDDECVKEINSGCVAIQNVKYYSKRFNRDCNTVKFVPYNKNEFEDYELIL